MSFFIPILLISIIGGFSISFFGFGHSNVGMCILLSVLFAIAIFVLIAVAFILMFVIMGAGADKKQKKPCYSSRMRKKLSFLMDLAIAIFNVKIHPVGFENIPNDEPFLVISNHRSNMDPIVLEKLLRKYKLAFIAKHTLFKAPLIGNILTKTGYLKLDRMDLGSGFEIVKYAQSYLDIGISVGVFPEGTRGPDDHDMLPFKTGCFLIATKMRKPIVVTTLKGTHGINEWRFIKNHHVHAKVLKVYRYEDYKDTNVNALAEEIRTLMLEDIQKD